MSVRSAASLSLIDAFMDAALDGNGWTPALSLLASATHSAHGQLIGIGGPRSVPFNLVPLSEAAKAEFIDIEGGNPAVNPRVAVSGGPVLATVGDDAYDAARPSLRSDAYREYERAHDIPYGCQTTLLRDGEFLVGLAMLRTQRDGRTSPGDMEMFGSIAPHVRGAVRMQLALGGEGAQLIAGALEASGAAAFICDVSGRVRALTARAELVVDSGRILRLSRGELRAVVDAEDLDLQQAISHALSNEEALRHGPLQREFVFRGADPSAEPTLVHVSALPHRPWAFGFFPRAIVLVRSVAIPQPAVAVLVAAFGLTEAEAEVARLMCTGVSRDKIAQARCVSVDTVRSQLKSVFLKTGARREAELLSLLRRLA